MRVGAIRSAERVRTSGDGGRGSVEGTKGDSAVGDGSAVEALKRAVEDGGGDERG